MERERQQNDNLANGQARASRAGARAAVVHTLNAGLATAPGTISIVGAALSLTTEWQLLKATLAASADAAGTLSLEVQGWAPGERAAVVWLDDATVLVSNGTAAVAAHH